MAGHEAGVQAGVLTAVSPSGAGWSARPLALEAGAAASHVAGDGHHTVAAYSVRAPAGADDRSERCRLALIDASGGVVSAAHTVCAPDEAVLSLAVAAGRGGEPVAYLGIWRTPSMGAAAARHGRPEGRIVAVNAATGSALRTVAVDQIASSLAVAPARTGAAARLLCACGSPDADRLGRDDLREAVTRWQVLEFEAETLLPAAVYPVSARPHALDVAPDGSEAYLLTGGLDIGARASLLRLDLGGGGVRTLAVLPGRAAGLTAGAERVYVPHLDGRTVWLVDRRRGRLAGTLPAGRRPVAVALSLGHART
jgi:hypothetical protein